MEKAILAYDSAGMSIFSNAKKVNFLGRDVRVAVNIFEAMNEALNNADKYAAMITEPYACLSGNEEQLESYKKLLEKVVLENTMPVIIYSTMDEKTAVSEMGLKEGIHYTKYVHVTPQSPTKALKETLDSLLK